MSCCGDHVVFLPLEAWSPDALADDMVSHEIKIVSEIPYSTACGNSFQHNEI